MHAVEFTEWQSTKAVFEVSVGIWPLDFPGYVSPFNDSAGQGQMSDDHGWTTVLRPLDPRT